MTVTLRPETAADHSRICDMTQEAFAPMPFADGDEGFAIGRMRKAGDLVLSLVAENAGTVIGHIAFSPVTIAGRSDRWFALGPVAVDPAHQGRGVGRMLIEGGLSRLKAQIAGAKGVVLTGNPDLYSRFGFASDGRLTYGGLHPRYILFHSFDARPPPAGEVRFVDGLET